MEDFSVAGLSISKVVTSSFNPSSYRFTNGPIGTPSHTPQRRSIQVPRTSCHGPSPATDPIHATVAGTPSTHCTDGSSHGRKVPPVRLQPGTPVPTRKKWMFPQSQPFPCCKGFQASHIGTTICFWLGLFFFFFFFSEGVGSYWTSWTVGRTREPQGQLSDMAPRVGSPVVGLRPRPGDGLKPTRTHGQTPSEVPSETRLFPAFAAT